MAEPDTKGALRERAQALVRGLSPEAKAELSAAARARLLARPEWQQAALVGLYVPMRDEVDLWPLLGIALAAGKRVVLPAFDPSAELFRWREIACVKTDLAPGYRGILEPLRECAPFQGKRLDLILVPGVAFSPRGNRLGRGKGFYDRLLFGVSGLTCGTTFDERVFAEVPVEPHDILVNCILTPTRWIECCKLSAAAE